MLLLMLVYQTLDYWKELTCPSFTRHSLEYIVLPLHWKEEGAILLVEL